MRLRVCLIDETEHWNNEIADAAGKIFGVYLYNVDEVTHCCELTPSYELNFLQSVPLELPKAENFREKLLDVIDEGNFQTERVHYFHCHVIDRLPKIKRGQIKQGTYHYDRYKRKDFEMDDAIENWNGNPDY